MFTRESQLLAPLTCWLRQLDPVVRFLPECVVPWGKIDLLAVLASPTTILAFELKLSRGPDVLIQARNNRALCDASYAVLPILAAWRIHERAAAEWLDAGVGLLGVTPEGQVEQVIEHRVGTVGRETALRRAQGSLRQRLLDTQSSGSCNRPPGLRAARRAGD
jgi:hypothetical protein